MLHNSFRIEDQMFMHMVACPEAPKWFRGDMLQRQNKLKHLAESHCCTHHILSGGSRFSWYYTIGYKGCLQHYPGCKFALFFSPNTAIVFSSFYLFFDKWCFCFVKQGYLLADTLVANANLFSDSRSWILTAGVISWNL